MSKKEDDEERWELEAKQVPKRIAEAARMLEIGPLFAMRLATEEALPGAYFRSGEWQLHLDVIEDAINETKRMANNTAAIPTVADPKWELDRDEVETPECVAPLGSPYTWPHWMNSHECCEACGHDGRYNQLEIRLSCKAFQRSRYMRR